jgi:hypothetical protein
MTDLEIIQKQLAQTSDRLDQATARIAAIGQEKQQLGFDLHLGEDQAKAAARTRLGQLRHELSSLVEEKDTLSGAIAELKRRLADAQQTAADADATERRSRVRALLVELEACGPAMDRTVEHPEGGLRRINDPQSRVKVAALVGSLLVELRALGITEARFPVGRYDVGAWQDLRKAILDTMHAGWPAPAQRVSARERDSFTGLLAAFARIVRGNLGGDQSKAA